MTQTSYVNPNGLPADGQITSARDLAILARAVIRDLPEYEYFMHIPSIRYGRRVTHNFNKLIGRYPGADGFKTGFICASGYNLVASATRNGKRLIAVVLGASSGQARAVRAAQMMERGFGGSGLGWLKPALGTVDSLVPVDASPPNLRDEMCNGKRKRPATDEDADVVANNGSASTGESAVSFFTAGLQPPVKPADMLAAAPEPSEPVPVYTGPTKTGAALIAAVAAEAEKQASARRGKKSKIAAKKPDAATTPKAEGKAEANAKPAGAKPAAVRHAAAKPDASAKPAASADRKPAAEKKPAAKPAAAGDKPAPKPAKPNAAAKPKSENKPAG
jgi:D-alanyl-D-alanine carboxypeptidase